MAIFAAGATAALAGPACAEGPADRAPQAQPPGAAPEERPPAGTLEQRPREGVPEEQPRGEAPRAVEPPLAGLDRWGLVLAPDERGARIDYVDVRGPASDMLLRGDVVVAADGRSIADGDELALYLDSVEVGQPVMLELLRRGRTRFVGIQIPPPPTARRAAPAGPTSYGGGPPTAPAQPPAVVVVIQQGGAAMQTLPGTPFVGGGAGEAITTPAPQPPSYSAPGGAVPGATFAPAPGAGAWTYPQLPGVSQPPGWQERTLRPGPTTGPATGPGGAEGTMTGGAPGTIAPGGAGATTGGAPGANTPGRAGGAAPRGGHGGAVRAPTRAPGPR